MHLGRTLVAHSAYPVLLAATVLTARWLDQVGWSPLVSVGLLTVVVGGVIALLEVVLPARREWGLTPRALAIDLLHSVVTSGGAAQVAKALVLSVGTMVSIVLVDWTGSGVWPDEWPFLVQLALAVVWSDLGAYVGHRTLHAWSVGWRVHAVHHSSERLHLMATSRSHPFNGAFTFGLETAMIVMVGVPAEVLVVVMAIKSINGMLQHANVDLRPGLLSYVLATNLVHAWHHARQPPEGRVVNFGNTTTVWDQLFGTFYLPAQPQPPQEVGNADVAIPEHYGWHLAAPFVFERLARDAGDPSVHTTACASRRGS
ncbi:MAG: sterol desaturase family protein [Myxococcota bacterium]